MFSINWLQLSKGNLREDHTSGTELQPEHNPSVSQWEAQMPLSSFLPLSSPRGLIFKRVRNVSQLLLCSMHNLMMTKAKWRGVKGHIQKCIENHKLPVSLTLWFLFCNHRLSRFWGTEQKAPLQLWLLNLSQEDWNCVVKSEIGVKQCSVPEWRRNSRIKPPV